MTYYETQYKEFIQRTESLDPSYFLANFLEFVPEKSTILDIGCGYGRDMNWLTNLGHTVVGIEKSEALCRYALEKFNLNLINADFRFFDFTNIHVDAAIAIASLLHLPFDDFEPVLGRILLGLKTRGVILVALKEGQGIYTDRHGRDFYLWNETNLTKIFYRLGLKIIKFYKLASKQVEGEIWLNFILQKYLT